MPTHYERKSPADADAIAFLVRFINADLDQYREGDWLNLQDDLVSFGRAELAGLSFNPTDQPMLSDALVARAFRRLQQDLRELLRPIAESQSAIDPQSRFGRELARHSDMSSESTRPLEGAFFTVVVEPGDAPRLKVSARSTELTFIKAVLLMLVVTSTAQTRLRLCPECGAVFLRVRKQLYCSRRCVNRANMRAWLSEPNRKASHRASSTRSYAKRVRARTHARVKVGGRIKR